MDHDIYMFRAYILVRIVSRIGMILFGTYLLYMQLFPNYRKTHVIKLPALSFLARVILV